MLKDNHLLNDGQRNSILDLVTKLLIDCGKSTDGNQRKQLRKEIQSLMMKF